MLITTLFRGGHAALLALTIAGLSGCGLETLPSADGSSAPAVEASGGSDSANRIVASGPAAPVAGRVGSSTPVTVSFTTSDGKPATVLEVTNLAALSSEWHAAGGSFSCANLSAATPCDLNLDYRPLRAGGGSAAVDYRYLDSNGAEQTGSLTMSYGATLHAAFTPDLDSGDLYRCLIVEDGSLESCVVAATGFSRPVGIAIKGRDLYVMNSRVDANGQGQSSKCRIADDGAVADCVLIDPIFGSPMGVALNGQGQAYMTSTSDNIIRRCDLAEDGSFVDCQDETPGTPGSQGPHGVSVLGNSLYYVTFGPEGVVRCDIAADGGLSGCAAPGSGSLGTPYNVVMEGANAWLTSFEGVPVMRCRIDQNGDFNDCADAAVGFSGVDAFGFARDGDHAFITHVDGITRCDVTIDDLLINCLPFNVSPRPAGLVITTLS